MIFPVADPQLPAAAVAPATAGGAAADDAADGQVRVLGVDDGAVSGNGEGRAADHGEGAGGVEDDGLVGRRLVGVVGVVVVEVQRRPGHRGDVVVLGPVDRDGSRARARCSRGRRR